MKLSRFGIAGRQDPGGRWIFFDRENGAMRQREKGKTPKLDTYYDPDRFYDWKPVAPRG